MSSVVINVQDDLARRLQAEADNKSTSAEDLAISILNEAVPEHNDWGKRNCRRLSLIRKSTRGELTAQEQAELDQLQGWLDEQFESFDQGLKNQLGEMKQAVANLVDEQSDG